MKSPAPVRIDEYQLANLRVTPSPMRAVEMPGQTGYRQIHPEPGSELGLDIGIPGVGVLRIRMPTTTPLYHCNGYSIPWFIPSWLAHPWEHGWQAAVWHDYMRELLHVRRDGPLVRRYNRMCGRIWWDERVSDMVFLRLMEHYGKSWWRRRAYYRAVRGESWVRRRLQR